MKSLRSGRKPPPARRWRAGLRLAGLTLALCAGCAGYRLGPSNGQVAGSHSIQVRPFENQTLQPRLGDALTAALRKSLQQDGTYRLATHDDGDIVVAGRITHYDRTDLTFNPNDILTVLDYRVVVTTHVTARERSTGRTILDRDVTGYTLVRPGPDLTSAERQAMPLLAYDLAQKVAGLLVDGNW